jgi:hypothetical protein
MCRSISGPKPETPDRQPLGIAQVFPSPRPSDTGRVSGQRPAHTAGITVRVWI